MEVKEFIKQFSSVQRVIVHLFPMVALYFDVPVRPRGIKPQLTNGHILISENKYFMKYFMYQTAHQEISEKEMNRFLKGISHSDIDSCLKELYYFEGLYEFNKILDKLSKDAPILNDSAVHAITRVFKKRYDQLKELKARNDIIRMLAQVYHNKQEQFFKSVLEQERPIYLFLTISIGKILALYSKNNSDIEEKLNLLIKNEFKENTLDYIFSNQTKQERQWVFIKWISKEKDIEFKQQKTQDYVKDMSYFRELVEYILIEYQNYDPHDLLLIILENFGVGLTRSYLIEIVESDDSPEFKEMNTNLHRIFQDIFHYLLDQLATALENSKKGEFPVKMKTEIERLIEIFKKDKDSEEEMKPINEILLEIEEYNRKLIKK
ncbi:hypothetical protein ABC382_19995 [Lysinibacillus sp. 1P01SD]|uniref:hypothetical protein n=1 Tax=Lysinibacillus sp. 1P01SD TaxID=3132285 RepID=UPI0039A1E49A